MQPSWMRPNSEHRIEFEQGTNGTNTQENLTVKTDLPQRTP